jgi:hypothetical protein
MSDHVRDRQESLRQTDAVFCKPGNGGRKVAAQDDGDSIIDRQIT